MHIFSFVLVLKEQRPILRGFGFVINVFSFLIFLYLSQITSEPENVSQIAMNMNLNDRGCIDLFL